MLLSCTHQSLALCSVSGCSPVLLLPGEEPPPHVSAVERHIQQVCSLLRAPPGSVSHPADAVIVENKPMLSCSPHFNDEERLRVLVMMSAQELANGISYSGHIYAMTRAARHLTPAGELQESFGGIEQVQ